MHLLVLSLAANAQIFKYSSLRTSSYGCVESENDSQFSLVELMSDVEDIHEENKEQLRKEIAKPSPNESEVARLKEAIKSWENDNLEKGNIIGQKEPIDSYVEFSIDSDNKLKVIGKTSKSEVLFEFGKGHNQELILENDDANEYSIIWINVFNHNGGERIAKFSCSDINCLFMIGNAKKGERTEVVTLSFDSIEKNRKVVDGNETVRKQLIQRLLQIFPKDKDGDRWMLCK